MCPTSPNIKKAPKKNKERRRSGLKRYGDSCSRSDVDVYIHTSMTNRGKGMIGRGKGQKKNDKIRGLSHFLQEKNSNRAGRQGLRKIARAKPAKDI